MTNQKSTGARPRWVWPVVAVSALALVASGVAGVVLLSGDDDPAPKDTTSAQGGSPNPATPTSDTPSLLGEPGTEWSVDVRDIASGTNPYVHGYTAENSDLGAHVFEDTVVLEIYTDEGQEMVGLDPRSGDHRWSRTEEFEFCKVGKPPEARSLS